MLYSCRVDLSSVSPQDFVSTVIRLLDSPSTAIRAKAFLVLLHVLIHNRDMLLLSCQARYTASQRVCRAVDRWCVCPVDYLLLAVMYLTLKTFPEVYQEFNLSLVSSASKPREDHGHKAVRSQSGGLCALRGWGFAWKPLG